MNKMMKVAGKTSNSTAKGIRVDSDGKLIVISKREWEQTQLVVLDGDQIRDTNAKAAKPTSNDVSGFAYISFRIINSLDADVSIQFYDDWHVTGGSVLKDINGSTIEITVPAKVSATQNIVVTPDDLPILNLLHYLTLRVQAKTTPTSGSLSITAYGRK